MNEIKIFVADDVNEDKLEPLRAAGFNVEKRTKLTPDELKDALKDADGLIVRSATKVTKDIMDAATKLRVIGRAGVGVDNIDVAGATERGIVVMNAPDGNTITTGEHTMALLVALARNVPQACASLKDGKWDKKKYIGVELFGKTLGIIGLGRIGKVVATRAKGFGMNIVVYDPFISPEQARDMDIETATLDEVFMRADFITVHTPINSETRGIIGAEAFSKMKKGVRVINCARGGLVDESALCNAIKEGIVAGAALDVFEQEPPAEDNPLLKFDNVILTPHLGASTKEAQEGVALIVAEEMRDYLLTGTLRGSVNAPSLGAKELVALSPYISLAEKLGRFHAQIMEEDSAVKEVEIEFAGDVADMDATPVMRSFLAGLLRTVSVRANVVNASLIAEERGITVTTSYKKTSERASDIKTTVVTNKGEQTVAGTLFGPQREGRITQINSFRLEVIPHGYMLVTRNKDVPGVIGYIGTMLGKHNVNISRFFLGRNEKGGEAMAVIETDAPLDSKAFADVTSFEPIIAARQIEL